MFGNHKLSQIGLGTWQFSAGQGDLGAFWKALTQEQVTEIVSAAHKNGINWFDTAERYGDGASESSLARALQALEISNDEVFIADKWWPKKRKASSLIDSIDQRLKCLQGYSIGLYQIHWPESESWLRTEMKYLAQLVDTGKVSNVGLCNYNWRQVKRAHKYLKRRGVKLASVQVRYNLAHRSIEKNNLLSLARDLDIKIIAWSPLESGLLTGKFHRDSGLIDSVKGPRRSMYGFDQSRLERTRPLVDALETIAIRHSVQPSQVALRWLTQWHEGRVIAIPGASSAEQAKSNAQSMSVVLTPEELSSLDEVSMRICSLD